MNEAGSPSDERPAARVRRAAFQTYCPVCDGEKIHDADWSHWPPAFGPDNRPDGDRGIAPLAKGVAEIGVHRDNPSGFLLGGVVPDLDDSGNIPCRVQNHRPGQVRDFPGPQPGFESEAANDQRGIS